MDFFYYFLLIDEKRDSFLPSGSWIVLFWLPAETLSENDSAVGTASTPFRPQTIYDASEWMFIIMSDARYRTLASELDAR